MKFLNTKRVLANIRLAAGYLSGIPQSSEDAKSKFIEALNAAQSTTIRTVADDFVLDFDNPELVALLTQRTVFSSEETTNGAHLIPLDERASIATNIGAAKRLLQNADPNLYYVLTQLIGSVAAYRIPQRDGGSVSCCIGLIWLSPHRDWPISYYAEMLVHEFVHNSVFLEDMVRGIMPDPDLLEREEALSTSAIRQTRRPYDKSFHSACVAAALMYYYHAIGRLDESARYLAPLQRTIADLVASDRALRLQGLDVLTDNGRELLEELRCFVDRGPDHAGVATSLAQN